jgi:predicted GNAT family N-acyltransferase
MFEILKINPESTLEIRQKVLRPYQSANDCIYDTDYKEGALHVGAFHDGTLISVASFCVETNQELSMENQYRLRAMATLEEYRRLGAGRQVVNYAEGILKEYGTDLLWCKARTKVQAYYSNLGFVAHGEVFDYPPIGPHIIMYKFLR